MGRPKKVQPKLLKTYVVSPGSSMFFSVRNAHRFYTEKNRDRVLFEERDLMFMNDEWATFRTKEGSVTVDRSSVKEM